MKKFEYLVKKIEIYGTSHQKELNKLGEEGWELVCTTRSADKYDLSTFLYFKRKIIE